MIDTIEITKMEYLNLRLQAEELRRLNNAGVDNWEWHGDAIYSDEYNEITMDEFEENLKKEIYNGN